MHRKAKSGPQAIELRRIHPDATLVRLLGVNYIHFRTGDDGEMYVTDHGVPFIEHLDPARWLEPDWFAKHRQRLEGTGTVYRLSTRPLKDHPVPSIDLVVKWSRVGQDAALDLASVQRNVNAEFNTPFEEFARVEELRHGEHGPREIRILTQKPLAIYIPPQRLQLWQTGRSPARIQARTSRHPGIEIDILRDYIMLYGWIDGPNAVQAMRDGLLDTDAQGQQLEELTLRADRELTAKGFVVADHKPSHLIVRLDSQGRIRRRRGRVVYALVDFELLARTENYEDWVNTARRREYLARQSQRFRPRKGGEYPPDLRPARVLGVDYVYGHVRSTDGALWVVGCDPGLFAYFLPERWRSDKLVDLGENGRTFYAQTKDRVHLVWKISRVGELPRGDLADPAIMALLRQGFNSPFEEVALALKMMSRGLRTVYPRAVYMTTGAGEQRGMVLDDRRFEQMMGKLSPLGTPVMPIRHDYVTLWGFWRGLEDDQAVEDTMLWTPIDLTSAAAKQIIDPDTARAAMERHAHHLEAAGFRDSCLHPDHVLISYVPDGKVKTDATGQIETRQCNFEMVLETRSS